MRSAWRRYRRSIITLEEAVFKGRRVCQKCCEKFLRRKAEGGEKDEPVEDRSEMAETPREAGGEASAAAEGHVGNLEYDPS